MSFFYVLGLVSLRRFGAILKIVFLLEACPALGGCEGVDLAMGGAVLRPFPVFAILDSRLVQKAPAR